MFLNKKINLFFIFLKKGSLTDVNFMVGNA